MKMLENCQKNNKKFKNYDWFFSHFLREKKREKVSLLFQKGAYLLNLARERMSGFIIMNFNNEVFFRYIQNIFYE